MPICQLSTNLPKSAISKTLHQDLLKLVADLLGKPAEYISVAILPDVQMCRGPDDGPSATLHIWSVGSFNSQRNPKYTEAIMEFLKTHLKIPQHKVFLLYHGIAMDHLGM